jgi:hypothetical protein
MRGPACAALALLCACPAARPLPEPPPLKEEAVEPAQAARDRAQAEALFEQVRAAHQLPATLSAEAKAFVDAEPGGGRYGLLVAVQKPDSLRIDALLPWGDPAATLVAHQGRFFLRDERDHVFLRGRSTPQNLSRLLPAPLRDDELVALLTGGAPELPGASPVRVEDAGDGNRRIVLSTLPAAGLTTLRGFLQTVVVGGDLRVLEVGRFVAGQRPALLWSARLDEHDPLGGAQVPRLLHLHIPKATSGEAKDIEIDLKLKNILAGKPPPAAAFVLVPPAGMRVEELE